LYAGWQYQAAHAGRSHSIDAPAVLDLALGIAFALEVRPVKAQRLDVPVHRYRALIHGIALPSILFLVTRLLCQNQQLTWHQKNGDDLRRDKTRLSTRGCHNV
jgi:hypothetical protein